MKNIVEVYCLVDNLVKQIDAKNTKTVGRPGILSKSCYVTLAIFKQTYGIKTIAHLYEFAKEFLRGHFPNLPSYQQFSEGIKNTFRYFLVITYFITQTNRKKKSNKHIVDSTPVPVCRNQHRFKSKIFKGLAGPGKNMHGWFFGFKLHLIINNDMEIESIAITSGSTHDSKVLDGDFIDELFGWIVGDKGYTGKEIKERLAKKGLNLVTKPRKNMLQLPTLKIHQYLLSRRKIVESVFNSLKNNLTSFSSYSRSIEGFFVNVLSAIVTYSINLKKNIFDYQAISDLSIS